MILFRVFNWLETAKDHEVGGVFYNPQPLQRTGQSGGRHDVPQKDGVLYCSQNKVSPIAEQLKGFTNRKIKPSVFRREKIFDLALIAYRLDDDRQILPLDDPKNLVMLESRTSEISTTHREVTQTLAGKVFDRGYDGLSWPSVIDGSWMNVSLFYSRVIGKLVIEEKPLRLNFENEFVQQAAERLMIELAGM